MPGRAPSWQCSPRHVLCLNWIRVLALLRALGPGRLGERGDLSVGRECVGAWVHRSDIANPRRCCGSTPACASSRAATWVCACCLPAGLICPLLSSMYPRPVPPCHVLAVCVVAGGTMGFWSAPLEQATRASTAPFDNASCGSVFGGDCQKNGGTRRRERIVTSKVCCAAASTRGHTCF